MADVVVRKQGVQPGGRANPIRGLPKNGEKQQVGEKKKVCGRLMLRTAGHDKGSFVLVRVEKRRKRD